MGDTVEVTITSSCTCGQQKFNTFTRPCSSLSTPVQPMNDATQWVAVSTLINIIEAIPYGNPWRPCSGTCKLYPVDN